jgi:uncharacterized membrane protein YdbT with pleckstrin-like domain
MNKLFSLFTTSTNSFEGQHENEKVLLYLHRHWYTLLSKMIGLFFAALIPFIVVAVSGPIINSFGLNTIVVFLFSVYYMVIWYVFGFFITMYTMDIWIVTDSRIIDSTQNGFFNRTVSEISLGNIQDITTMVSGAIPTMMNYGDVEVQSAGVVEHFKFQQVSNPQNVKDTVSRAMSDYKSKHFKNEAIEVVKEIEQMKNNSNQ